MSSVPSPCKAPPTDQRQAHTRKDNKDIQRLSKHNDSLSGGVRLLDGPEHVTYYVYIYIYMYICIYIYIHIYICIYTYVYIYIHIYVYSIHNVGTMYVCICICSFIYIYIYTYRHTCVYVYMCIYIYIYTYIHTYIHISPGGLRLLHGPEHEEEESTANIYTYAPISYNTVYIILSRHCKHA